MDQIGIYFEIAVDKDNAQCGWDELATGTHGNVVPREILEKLNLHFSAPPESICEYYI